MKKNHKKLNKKVFFVCIAVAILIIVIFVLEATNTINLVGNKYNVDKDTKSTSNEPSAQPEFSTSSSDKKEPAQSSGQPEAIVNDTSGAGSVQQNSAPLTSSDGVITVYSPTTNAVFTNGSTLSGKASTPKVSYRLIDEVTGVIATGQLNVINGSFSGKFSFTTTATQGRLDVFRSSNGGIEESIIEIPIRFR